MHERRHTVVVLVGEIDLTVDAELLVAVDQVAIDLPVVVDMQHVSFMDSTGLLFLERLARRSGRSPTVMMPSFAAQLVINLPSVSGWADDVTHGMAPGQV